MHKYRVIHGYNNGDVKWCVVCVDKGLRNAPIVSPIFDTAKEADREMRKMMLLQYSELVTAGGEKTGS